MGAGPARGPDRGGGVRRDEHEEQHDARVVEIITALLLGVITGVALLGLAWLVGRFALPPRELWDPVFGVVRPVAVGVSVLVVVGWLVRSSWRGP